MAMSPYMANDALRCFLWPVTKVLAELASGFTSVDFEEENYNGLPTW